MPQGLILNPYTLHPNVIYETKGLSLSKRRYRWKRIFGLVFTLAVIGIGSAPFLWVSDGRVIPGVTIHGTKTDGATEEELKELFSVKNADLLHGRLVFAKEDAHEEISFRSLSVRYDEKTIEKAMALGRTGGLFQRWYDRWRILLTGHGLGGELFFVGRAAQVGGRGAEGGSDDGKLLVVRLGFAGFPVLTDGGGPAETAGNRGFGDAGLANQGFKSGINEQISHLTFVQNVESNEYATYSP